MAGKVWALCGMLPLLLQALNTSPPRLIHNVEPVYPHLAQEMRIQGTVRLTAVIEDDGTVIGVKLISGHPLLVAAAIEAVKQWRYVPAERNGRPVRVAIQVEVGFSLSHGPPEQATRV